MTHIRVDAPAGARNTPAYRDIYQRVRSEILSGRLSARARLPSSRTLASQLGVARGTVELAYQILAGEGYTVSDGTRGTIVNPSLPSWRSPITFASSARKPPRRLRLPPKPLLFHPVAGGEEKTGGKIVRLPGPGRLPAVLWGMGERE